MCVRGTVGECLCFVGGGGLGLVKRRGGEGSLGKDCSGGMNASMQMADLAELEREKEKSDTHQMSDQCGAQHRSKEDREEGRSKKYFPVECKSP